MSSGSRRRDYLISALEDGLPYHDVGSYAVEKYRLVGSYAEMFSTSMRNHWDCRVYLDLFAGPGHAVIRETGQRVLTSPLIALSVPYHFDKYIFCDKDEEALSTLRHRVLQFAPSTDVDYVPGNINVAFPKVVSKIPEARSDYRVLSFCFADPFSIALEFDAVRAITASGSVDLMVLLALGMDANRNWRQYTRPTDRHVDRFLGTTNWRPRWKDAENRGHSPIRFLAEEYSAAMTGLGYRPMPIDTMPEIRMTGTNVPLYYLAFFSRSDLGLKFWEAARKASRDQLGLAL